MPRTTYLLGLIALLITATGCGQPSAQATATHAGSNQSLDATKYLLPDEPTGALGVMEAREIAKDQEEIVLMGRIGGRENPWVDGRAAFTVIDATIQIVADGQAAATGEVCLEGCCDSTLAQSTALVKVADEQGRVLAIDARKLLNAQENDMVVVRGRVQRDEQENFSVIANGVYVR